MSKNVFVKSLGVITKIEKDIICLTNAKSMQSLSQYLTFTKLTFLKRIHYHDVEKCFCKIVSCNYKD